jgi:TPR repeat protein
MKNLLVATLITLSISCVTANAANCYTNHAKPVYDNVYACNANDYIYYGGPPAGGAPYATCKAIHIGTRNTYMGCSAQQINGGRTDVYECSGKWEQWTKVSCPNDTAPHPAVKGCRTAVCGPDA